MDNLINNCKNCKLCKKNIKLNGKNKKYCSSELLIAPRIFVEHKQELLEEMVESEFQTYKKSFIQFILNFRKNEIESKDMINSILENVYNSIDEFDERYYKKIDLFISKWDSWYSRFSLFLKYLMTNGLICNYSKDVIISSIKDYNKNIKFPTKNYETILNSIYKYIYNMNLTEPIENGDFTKLLNEVHKILLIIYEVLILQFIQEESLYERNSNNLYWSHKYKLLDKDLEDIILKYRLDYILEKHDNFKLIIATNKEYFIDDVIENNSILKKYNNLIINK